jgi:quinol monooxygenase YgiN
MVVEYATWELEISDIEAYYRWMFPLIEKCRAEAGCLAYDYRSDPHNPKRGCLFQAWESREAFERHLEFPAHTEMLVRDKPWRTRDVVIQRWSDAGGHEIIRHPGNP